MVGLCALGNLRHNSEAHGGVLQLSGCQRYQCSWGVAVQSTDLMVSINQNGANPVHCRTFASSTPRTGRITRNFIDIIIVALVDYFRSVVRLASARLPKNPKSNLSFWRLPFPPIAPRTVPLCVRSPLPMAASAAFPAGSALPLRVPCPQVVVAGRHARHSLPPHRTCILVSP